MSRNSSSIWLALWPWPQSRERLPRRDSPAMQCSFTAGVPVLGRAVRNCSEGSFRRAWRNHPSRIHRCDCGASLKWGARARPWHGLNSPHLRRKKALAPVERMPRPCPWAVNCLMAAPESPPAKPLLVRRNKLPGMHACLLAAAPCCSRPTLPPDLRGRRVRFGLVPWRRQRQLGDQLHRCRHRQPSKLSSRRISHALARWQHLNAPPPHLQELW
mmetsp:Transcript_86604/g.249876  ORF Transcript_86604/g.249876 Transcript_86604/m.249876 type:complete len:215 (+) Transcript_86604:157-801(+)